MFKKNKIQCAAWVCLPVLFLCAREAAASQTNDTERIKADIAVSGSLQRDDDSGLKNCSGGGFSLTWHGYLEPVGDDPDGLFPAASFEASPKTVLSIRDYTCHNDDGEASTTRFHLNPDSRVLIQLGLAKGFWPMTGFGAPTGVPVLAAGAGEPGTWRTSGSDGTASPPESFVCYNLFTVGPNVEDPNVFISPRLSLTPDDFKKGFTNEYSLKGKTECGGPFVISGHVRLKYKKKPKVKTVPHPFDWGSYEQQTINIGGVRCAGWFRPNYIWSKENLPSEERGPGHEPPSKEKGPVISIEYHKDRDEWFITSITMYCISLIELPDKGGYPDIGKNVLDNPELRDLKAPRDIPDDPSGKGYWSDVIQNLCLYSSKNSPRMQWCIEGATKYHEDLHFELYKVWVEKQWETSFRKELETQLEAWLEDKDSVDEVAVRSQAESIFKGLMQNRPDTEPEVHARTKGKYYKPKAEEIYNHFNKDRSKPFQCGN